MVTALVAVAGLAACTPADPAADPEASAAPADTVDAPEAPAETPPPLTFTAPRTCSELLGPVLESQIAEGGYELFSSTAGSGKHYPIASTQWSGDAFSCWYGVDQVDLSSFEIAAQGLIPGEKDGAGARLAGEGFTSTTDGDAVTWVKAGNQGGEPAIVHVLRSDSWLTGYSEYGGATQVETLTGYLATVADTLYE